MAITSCFYKCELVQYRYDLFVNKNEYKYKGFCDALKGQEIDKYSYFESAQKCESIRNNAYITGFDRTRRLITAFIWVGGNPKELVELFPEYKRQLISVYKNEKEYGIARKNLQFAYSLLRKYGREYSNFVKTKKRVNKLKKISKPMKRVIEWYLNIIVKDYIDTAKCSILSCKKYLQLEQERADRMINDYIMVYRNNPNKINDEAMMFFEWCCESKYTLIDQFRFIIRRNKKLITKANTVSATLKKLYKKY